VDATDVTSSSRLGPEVGEMEVMDEMEVTGRDGSCRRDGGNS